MASEHINGVFFFPYGTSELIFDILCRLGTDYEIIFLAYGTDYLFIELVAAKLDSLAENNSSKGKYRDLRRIRSDINNHDSFGFHNFNTCAESIGNRFIDNHYSLGVD